MNKTIIHFDPYGSDRVNPKQNTHKKALKCVSTVIPRIPIATVKMNLCNLIFVSMTTGVHLVFEFVSTRILLFSKSFSFTFSVRTNFLQICEKLFISKQANAVTRSEPRQIFILLTLTGQGGFSYQGESWEVFRGVFLL